MHQKLVSIFLNPTPEHPVVCEHLEEYLQQGWRVAQLWTESGTAAGGRSDDAGSCAWLVVLLQQE